MKDVKWILAKKRETMDILKAFGFLHPFIYF